MAREHEGTIDHADISEPIARNERIAHALRHVAALNKPRTISAHKKEVRICGVHFPAKLERGALGEVANGVTIKDLHGREAGTRVARAHDKRRFLPTRQKRR